MSSKVDLHVHSKYSDRPSEWILRRIGSPECYTEPKTIYERARRRGMQFVTITDHNCIRGALDIAHLEGVLIGNEITTYFPEDRCKIHVLAWDITESQFVEIQRLREGWEWILSGAFPFWSEWLSDRTFGSVLPGDGQSACLASGQLSPQACQQHLHLA
jgi:predicted metal-dependent phosphoesterase TrpH